MRDKGFQVGLLFNHLPELVYFATNLFASEADFLVKLSQKVKKDPNITRDHQIFRKAAKKELLPDELFHYLALNNTGLPEIYQNIQDEYDIETKHIGGWYILLSQVKGFKLGLIQTDIDEELIKYLSFIEELCLLEYKIIKDSKNNKDLSIPNEFISMWLDCDPLFISEPTKANQAQYLIAMVMHWAALFEKLLEIEYSDCEESYHSIIIKSLPSVSKKKDVHYFHPSTEIFIINIKNNFYRKHNSNNKSKWSNFYKDIAIAQLTDPNMNIEPIKTDDDRLISPDISAIKKQITRWREGSRLSMEHFKKYFLILHQEYDANDKDFSLFSIELINLFSYIQKELLKNGTSAQVIVDCFAKYNDYKELVDKRFEFFKIHNTLKP